MRIDWIFLFFVYIVAINIVLIKYVQIQQYMTNITVDPNTIREIMYNISNNKPITKATLIIKQYPNSSIVRMTYREVQYNTPSVYFSIILENNTLVYIRVSEEWRRGRDSNPRPPGIYIPLRKV